MIAVPRTDNSILGRWWWTVDRWSMAALLVLAAVGAILVMAASPSVAERMKFDSFHFVHRHLAILGMAMILMIGVSLLSPTGVRRLAWIQFGVGLLLMVSVLVFGVDLNGARRWITFSGFSMQPSEFVKPSFVVVTAWLLARPRRPGELRGLILSISLLLVVITLLVAQPDFGMALVVGAVWFGQHFVAGMPAYALAAALIAGAVGLVAGYFSLSHVQSRINRFLDPDTGDRYQVDTALNAFANGGLLGRGPGEGVVKGFLPDAHADFIFAVAGEEFGLICCLAIICLFGFVVLRGIARLLKNEDFFVLVSGAGLVFLFGLQAFVNLAVALDLIPTKGMTLPFVSYGGSSMIALALGMGTLLALTRHHHQKWQEP